MVHASDSVRESQRFSRRAYLLFSSCTPLVSLRQFFNKRYKRPMGADEHAGPLVSPVRVNAFARTSLSTSCASRS